MSLPAHVEDDRAAHELVGHDQEGRGRVGRQLRGPGQLLLHNLTEELIRRNGSTGRETKQQLEKPF